jgi:ligand-binding sensor domain-containing protein
MYKPCSLFIFIIWVQLAQGQNYFFNHYNSSNGLSQNTGYAIAQDGLGYIWVGTQDGLNRLNGNTVTHFFTQNIQRGALTSNFINSLYYQQSKNLLWIGTNEGLCVYNQITDSFYTVGKIFPQATALSSLMIRSILPISDNQIGIITTSVGLQIINTSTGIVTAYFNQTPFSYSTRTFSFFKNNWLAVSNERLVAFNLNNNAFTILDTTLLGDVRNSVVCNNKMFIASANKGLFKVEESNGKYLIKKVDVGTNLIGCLVVDEQNHLWIGSRDKGLIIIEPSTLKIIDEFSTATNAVQWPPKFTLCLIKDRQNHIWAGTSGGGVNLCKQNKLGIQYIAEMSLGQAVHNMSLAIAYQQGTLYIGTLAEGLRGYKNNQLIKFKNNVAEHGVYGIDASTPGYLYLATTTGLQLFNTQTGITKNISNPQAPASQLGVCVYRLPGTDSLFYSSNKGSTFYNPKNNVYTPIKSTNKKTDSINWVAYCAQADNNKNLWVGSLGMGLVQYNWATQHFTIIQPLRSISKNVRSIYVNLPFVFAGTDNGLVQYNIQTNTIEKHYNAANGLLSNVVYGILPDEQGRIWLSTNKGISILNLTNQSFIHLTATLGLQADEFNTNAAITLPNGNLSFAGINGVNIFNPSRLLDDTVSLNPFVEAVLVKNKVYPWINNIAYTNTVNLSHNENFITIQYGTNDFNNIADKYFAYQLQGADADWVIAGSRLQANYSNLAPGKYTFKIKSRNRSGVWSNPVSALTIIIQPAFWQTWWFKLLCTLLIAALIYWLVKKRIANVRAQGQARLQTAALKQQVTETEMQALRLQMNPHFLFNSLNSINSFIVENKTVLASDYLTKFSRLMRLILENSRKETISLEKELETIRLYLLMESLRFNNKFEYKINVEDDSALGNLQVPPLIIQPFAENAIWHGLLHKPEVGLLEIYIKTIQNQLQITVTDNGIGRQQAALLKSKISNSQKSYGLEITNQRLAALNANNIIHINDLVNEQNQPIGTQVIILIAL